MSDKLGQETLSEVQQITQKIFEDPNSEKNWAGEAVKHSRVYFRLLSAVPDLTALRLTQVDDLIYSSFRETFPTLNVETLNEEQLKSDEQRKIWRPLLHSFKGKIDIYNFGTLLRLDAKRHYEEENVSIVTRAQFYCIEIARNREGINDSRHLKSLPLI